MESAMNGTVTAYTKVYGIEADDYNAAKTVLEAKLATRQFAYTTEEPVDDEDEFGYHIFGGVFPVHGRLQRETLTMLSVGDQHPNAVA